MSRPLMAALAAYISGIVIGSLFRLPFLLLAGFAVTMIILGVYSRYFSWRKSALYFLLALMALGAFMYQWQEHRNRGNISFLDGKEVIVRGTITEEPDIRINAVNYVVKVEEAEILEYLTENTVYRECNGKILVTVKGKSQPYFYGDRVEIKGVPELPEEPGNVGEFNYKKYLQVRGIQLVVKSWGGTGIWKTGTGQINPFVDASLAIKKKLSTVLASTLPEKQAGLAQAILFGSYGLLDPQVRNDFALTGVVHILSVSGYHVGVLTVFCLMLGSAMGLGRGACSILTVAVTGTYVMMTGASPPVVRAAIMAWLLLLARWVRKDYDWLTAIALAALLIVFLNPSALFDVGFQLSFLATWGILELAPLAFNALSSTFGGSAAAVLSVGRASVITLAAQIAVLPVTTYYFNYISAISLPANLVVVPLVSLAMLLGGSAALAGALWLPLGEVLNVSTRLILDLVLGIAHFMAGLPFAVFTVGRPPVIAIIGFYVLLVFVIEIIKKPGLRLRLRRFWSLRRSHIALSFLLAIALLIWTSILITPSRDLEITFIDIGQGDAIYVRTPQGRNILVDTGGAGQGSSTYSPGDKILIPFLTRLGIDRLDVVVLTHAHADHIQGAESLLGRIAVDKLVVNPQFCENPDGARIVKEFAGKGTAIHKVIGGDKIVCEENITFEILYPFDSESCDTGENNNSLIARLCYGEFEALLTGDAEAEALQELAGGRAGFTADVVKMPHHGSNTGWVEEFYKLTGLTSAVISVGPNNFGHPSPEVLRGLAGMGINVFRTDGDGAVIIRSDGKHYNVETGKIREKRPGDNS